MCSEGKCLRDQVEQDVANLTDEEIDSLLEEVGLPDETLIPKLILYKIWLALSKSSLVQGDWNLFIESAESRVSDLISRPIRSIFEFPFDPELATLLGERLGIETVADLCRFGERHLLRAGFNRSEVASIKNALTEEDPGLCLMG